MHDLNYNKEQLEKRLSQGYYDDIIAIGIKNGLWEEQNPPSKEDIDLGLFVAATKDFLSLLKKYIDNDTIYFDEKENVIKAKKTQPQKIFTIQVSINPGDEDKCHIIAEGDIQDQSINEGTYLFKVIQGADLKITIDTEQFYTVSQVNVDKNSQGAISTYTFKDIQQDHTMYVWIKEEDVSSVDFLERSDNPGVLYSGIGQALSALKQDYPDGLDKDITIKCVQRALEIRQTDFNSQFGIWTSKFYDFNKDSIYTITIDGQNQYTIDCKWLGGLYFEDVDNVIIERITFRNYCNHAGQQSPDELAAIFLNSKEDVVKNYILHHNTFMGNFPYNGKYYASWYGITMKNIHNVIIDNNDLTKGGSVVVTATGCSSIEITRNKIQGVYPINTTLAHPLLLNLTSNNGVAEINDNIIDGEGYVEYSCQLNGFNEIYLNRNIIRNCSGQPFYINKDIKNIDVIDNLFYNNITGGQYVYLRHIIGGELNIDELNVKNNTVYFNGEFSSSQDFVYCTSINKLYNYNNIFINKLGKASSIFYASGIKNYYSGNNLYSSAFYNDDPTKRFLRLRVIESKNNDQGEGYIDFSFETRSISDMKNKGYEQGSWAIDPNNHVLNIENNIDNYKLIDDLKNTYTSLLSQSPEFDIDYLKKQDKCSIGSYNLFGIQWDENEDASEGYQGFNMVDTSDVFNDQQTYVSPAKDNILISINNKNRNNIIKSLFVPEEGRSILRYGKIISVSLECIYNKDTGMYIKDNNYSIQINKSSYGK